MLYQTFITKMNAIQEISQFNIFSLLSSSDTISRSVMVILVITSILSWSIILSKFFLFSKINKQISNFENSFWSGVMLEQLYTSIKHSSKDDPLSRVFISAMNEYKYNTITNNNQNLEIIKSAKKDRILQSMHLIKNRELEKAEKNLSLLATIGSNTLFVGLFGTVWGIINSFQSIAASKSTSLAVVAPGIAEALIATAIGLLVALPASIFFNYFSSKIISIDSKINDFIGELSIILSRAIDEDKV